MSKVNWTYLAIGLVVLLLILLILGFSLGWFKRGLKLVEGEGEVDRLSSGAIDESRYRSIAKGAKNSLEGTNYQNTYFIAVADQLLALNYNELRVVANIYDQEFGTRDVPTLRSLIMGEFVGASGFGTVPTPCTASEQQQVGSACYKQKLVIDKLNYINA